MPYTETIIARFLAKVRRCQHGEECEECCWEWQGAHTRGGYGNFSIYQLGGTRVFARAHRVAWEIAHQEFISVDLWCLHQCDTPPCCNPSHLFLGTPQDNTDDMWRKGRGATGALVSNRGERHGGARLTARDVSAIRARAGTVTQARLAHTYGVCPATIAHIVTGRNWKHLRGK